MATRRIERLKKVILRRASDVILYELHDPRLGFVTLSKVELTQDIRHATIYYSVIGADAERSRTGHALEDARGYIQKQIAAVLKTRVTPQIRFRFDESIEGVLRISRTIDEARAQDEEARRQRGGTDALPEAGAAETGAPAGAADEPAPELPGEE
ncbi:MAG: 30S ribosome-binding factor RbfA [Planctomycetes bacterium]|nr:30S ribosome-binding factor RbfA [Planctomycetota bacterium]